MLYKFKISISNLMIIIILYHLKDCFNYFINHRYL